MTNIPCPVPSCDRPRPGNAQICGACSEQLARDLGDIPALVDQLDLTLSRQTSGTQGRGSEKPLPYDPRVSDAMQVMRSVLVGWTRVLLDDATDDPWPADTLPDLARWLLARHPRLIRHAAADEIAEEIGTAVRTAERCIDHHPAERWFAGPCECGTDLYAKPGAVTIICRECGTEHQVAERREYLLGQIEDLLAPASQIAFILSLLVGELKPGTVWKWAERRRILPHGTDLKGRPLYRVGDVREPLMEMLDRSQKRQERMSA